MAKKIEDTFVSTEFTNIVEHDGQTDIAWRHRPRLCTASHGIIVYWAEKLLLFTKEQETTISLIIKWQNDDVLKVNGPRGTQRRRQELRRNGVDL